MNTLSVERTDEGRLEKVSEWSHIKLIYHTQNAIANQQKPCVQFYYPTFFGFLGAAPFIRQKMKFKPTPKPQFVI